MLPAVRLKVLEVEGDERNDEADRYDRTGDRAEKEGFPPATFTHGFLRSLSPNRQAAAWCIYAIDTSLPHIEKKCTRHRDH